MYMQHACSMKILITLIFSHSVDLEVDILKFVGDNCGKPLKICSIHNHSAILIVTWDRCICQLACLMKIIMTLILLKFRGRHFWKLRKTVLPKLMFFPCAASQWPLWANPKLRVPYSTANWVLARSSPPPTSSNWNTTEAELAASRYSKELHRRRACWALEAKYKKILGYNR